MRSPRRNLGPVVDQAVIALDAVRREIADATFRPGEMLPSLPSLAVRYGVNIRAVRMALEQVAADGVLIYRPGAGHYLPWRQAATTETDPS